MVNITLLVLWIGVLAILTKSASVPLSGIRWVDCAKNVPQSSQYFNTSSIDLTSLPSTLRCGQIDVPIDYSKPFLSTNMITLGLGMHRTSKPKGALFQ